MPSGTIAPMRDLGPCCLVWDPSGVNKELSPVHGGVMFRSQDQGEDIHEDGQGVAPVDFVFTGRIVEVEAPLTRSDLDQLNAVIAGSVKVGSVLSVSNRVGQAVFANAKELILKPMEDNVCSTDDTEWLHIWRCYPIHAFEVGYDISSGQRVFNVKFKVFPDDTSGRVGEMWQLGT